MCSCHGNFGWREQALLHDFICASRRHAAWYVEIFTKLKSGELTLALGWGVRIVFHMAE